MYVYICKYVYVIPGSSQILTKNMVNSKEMTHLWDHLWGNTWTRSLLGSLRQRLCFHLTEEKTQCQKPSPDGPIILGLPHERYKPWPNIIIALLMIMRNPLE